MKHTDFTKQIEETKRAEACELLSALIAHGGSYTFPKSLDLTIRMGTDRPRVVGAEANGCSVSLTLESMFGSEQYITNAFEAWPGEMSKITEAIPPTSRVHDVSADIQSALGGIELYDIDEIGYSTEGITQDILDQIAEKMVEDYTHGERRKDLERALIELNVPLKKKEEHNDNVAITQEITAQAMWKISNSQELRGWLDIPRERLFKTFAGWATEFQEMHKNTDWSDALYYEEIDIFIEKKITKNNK